MTVQVGRLESIFSRKQVEDDGQAAGAEGGEETEISPTAPSSSNAMVVASAVAGAPGGAATAAGAGGGGIEGGPVLTALRVGAPAVCLRLLTDSLLALVKNDREHREARFAQVDPTPTLFLSTSLLSSSLLSCSLCSLVYLFKSLIHPFIRLIIPPISPIYFFSHIHHTTFITHSMQSQPPHSTHLLICSLTFHFN